MGVTAIDLRRKLRPDLVIMDIKMPEVDGIAAAEMLTREQIAPVVLLTAYSDQSLVERARRSRGGRLRRQAISRSRAHAGDRAFAGPV